MSFLKNFIKIKSLFEKEDAVIYVAPCGTVVEKAPLTIDIEEGKELAKFNPITGKLYWPSDGSEADGPGIRDIPNYKNKDEDLVEQKPAWSEEDELMLKYTIEHFEREKRNSIEGGARKNSMQEFIDWLKSIKDKVQTKPKQEWSEEEQQIIKDAASFILSCVNTAETKKEEERLEELADKLQDLRPQSQWKPSDEQIEYLAKAITTLGDEGDCKTASILNDLRVELKKLREK